MIFANKCWNEQLGSVRRIPEIITELWHASAASVVWSVILRVLLAVLPPLTLWISKRVIDSIVALQRSPVRMWSHVWEYVFIEFMLIVATDIAGRVANHNDLKLSEMFSHRLSVRVLAHAHGLELETLEDPAFQDRLERTRTQISTQLAVLFSIAQLIQNSVGLFALISAVVFYAKWLVGLQIVTLVPLAITEIHYARVIHEKHLERTPLRRTMDYLMNLSTNSSTVKEIKAFKLGGYFLSEYSELGETFKAENVCLSRARNSIGGALTAIGSAAYYGAYAYLVWQAGTGEITIGTLFFLGASFQRSKWQLQEILTTMSRTLDQVLQLGDIFEYFTLAPPQYLCSGTILFPNTVRCGFEFHNVSFRYAGDKQYVLNDISFTISHGETVALVGDNGAGKTTLTKLLTRLYRPTGGRILLDGVDIWEYDNESFQRAVSVVFQDFVRYEMTAGMNIALGDLTAKDDLARLDSAARAGHADSLIGRLRDGYRQQLGKRFNGGIELSGGEWQKLALARACMRNAQLLILDEPSASMDPKNETLLLGHFSELISEKMAVLISHRLPMVRMAHKILLLERGRIIEHGSHEHLMANGRTYASMFHLQASGYSKEFQFARRNDTA